MGNMNGNGRLQVMIPESRPRGTVTERLAARLGALEPVIARLLANEAKLIADSLTAQRDIRLLQDYANGLKADIALLERVVRPVTPAPTRRRSLQPSDWRFKMWMLILDLRDWWCGKPPAPPPLID